MYSIKNELCCDLPPAVNWVPAFSAWARPGSTEFIASTPAWPAPCVPAGKSAAVAFGGATDGVTPDWDLTASAHFRYTA